MYYSISVGKKLIFSYIRRVYWLIRQFPIWRCGFSFWLLAKPKIAKQPLSDAILVIGTEEEVFGHIDIEYKKKLHGILNALTCKTLSHGSQL